jgi:radical SAM/Cys-rich protein
VSVLPTLVRSGSELATPARQVALLDGLELTDSLGADFDRHLDGAGLTPLRATGLGVFQVNVGKLCNQTCAHCHVDAGPDRREVMTQETAELCMRVLARTEIPTVDITGGAPEMCPAFDYLVRESRRLGRHVMDRCNLTIFGLAKYAYLPEFLAENQVEVICSLPHYRALNTDRQRGDGVFERSIEGLRKLNALGYGKPGSGLRLVLVTNPVGAFLPSSDASLTDEWKREMKRMHDIVFDELFTITNMPISRFLDWLQRSGNLEGYMQRLLASFNPAAASGVMCRDTLSVGWDGRLYDCDFNQMLDLGVDASDGVPRNLSDLESGPDAGFARLGDRRIVTGRHCFGCTAGAGSSCGGSLE